MRRLRILTLPVLLQLSCGQEAESKLSSELGAGMMRPVDEGDEAKVASAIGRLDSQCTVFHIGDGLVASAAHCFDHNVEAGNPCIAHQIHWQDGSSSQCVQVLDYVLDEQQDYAIIEVDPAPQGKFELVEDSELDGGELVVLGYPAGQELLHISEECQIESQDHQYLQHNCPTLPGHSGSPMLRAKDLRVVGIHNGNHSANANYGTSFPRRMQQWQGQREGRSSGQVWGPFANNQKELLYHISSEQGERVSFTLEYTLEDGYDFIFVQDGRGVRQQITGEGEQHFSLLTPVLVTFESDYAGESEQVNMKDLLLVGID